MRLGKKTAAVLLAAAAISAAFPGGAQTLNVCYGSEDPENPSDYRWEKVTAEDGDFWMYRYGSRSYVHGCKKEIDGKVYFFDDSGKMLSGWISGEGDSLDDEDGMAYQEGAYYCGGPDEGAAATGWRYLQIQEENGDRRRRWFYFKDGGRKAVNTSITESDENGQYRYRFDEYGILRSSRKIGEGQRKEQWIHRIPTSSQDSYASDNEIQRWYYGLSNGKVVQDRIKTIGGREYLFDQAGIMRTGLVAVTRGKKYAETLICEGDEIDCSVESLEGYLEEYDLMYFDEKSGARRTGNVMISSGSETYTFRFRENGKAAHGPYDGKLYRAGMLQKAENGRRYEEKSVGEKEYLVDSSGRIQEVGRYQDGETVWTVKKEKDGYVIGRGQR